MRFGKLKIIVGIALVIFVLVVANVIIMGYFSSNQYQTPINSNPSGAQSSVPKSLDKNVTSGGNQTAQTTPIIVAPTTTRTTVTQNTRTRAS